MERPELLPSDEIKFELTLYGQPLHRVADVLEQMEKAGVDVEVTTEYGYESSNYTIGLAAAGKDVKAVSARIRAALDYVDRYL